jgi:PPM family protein phosphatase
VKIDSHHIIIGNSTDQGKIRPHNEDYLAHFDTPLGYCVIICDGMGGHAAGDIASQSAVEAMRHFLQNKKITVVDIPTSLRNAIEFANFKLKEMVQFNAALKGMGTTCVMALIQGSKLFVAHAGDSRLYLIRNGKLQQISKDHSAVQNLIDVGILTEEEAELSDKKNQITKAIGIYEKVEPSVTPEGIPLIQNDRILLCSDGLTLHVNNKNILDILNSFTDVQTAVIRLVEKANEEGGADNITVQLIQYLGESAKKATKKISKRIIITLFIIICITIAGYLIFADKLFDSSSKEEIKKHGAVFKQSIPDDSLDNVETVNPEN